jgi:ketosteroid isomerase-like protein
VVEMGTFSGTHTGVFHTPDGDIPPTGRPVKAPYVNVLSFRDGMFVAGDLMFDRLALLEQLGLVPEPAAG